MSSKMMITKEESIVSVRVEHTCKDEYEKDPCIACNIKQIREDREEEETLDSDSAGVYFVTVEEFENSTPIEVHECQFYTLHRANGPPGFSLYCKQCIARVPHGDPEDYYVD